MLATSVILTTGNHHCTSDTGYLNHDQGHHCAHPQRVRITDDSFMWRTNVIFPWRDSLLLATMFDFWIVDGLPTQLADCSDCPHVRIGQGLQQDQQATLVCVTGQSPHFFFAHVFPRRVVCREIARFVVPSEHAHLPVTIQCQGQTFLWDDPIFLQSGDCIRITVHPAEFDPCSPQISDGFSMMQQGVTISRRSRTHAVATKTSKCRYFYFRHLMKILVVI